MKKTSIPPIDGPHKEFAARFREALAWAGVLAYDKSTGRKAYGSYEIAAEALGCTKVYVGELYRGQKFPSGSRLPVFAKKLEISAEWLATGEGPMVADMLINIEHLTPENQVKILTLLRSMERGS